MNYILKLANVVTELALLLFLFLFTSGSKNPGG